MATMTITDIQTEATKFAVLASKTPHAALYGVDNGKRIGTHIEHAFRSHLELTYPRSLGNSAAGLDFPEHNLDIKTTSIKQPQSSCPYKSADQKIFGLGYDLLVFVYAKTDDPLTKTALLDIQHAVYINAGRTADYQLTTEINRILANDGNEDDLIAMMRDKALPVGDIEATALAEKLMALGQVPVGCLTISNAQQWRLAYTRAIATAGKVAGITRIF